MPIEDWLFSFKHLDENDVVMIKTNGGDLSSEIINGIWYETLNEDSVELLKAVHEDKVYDFLSQHPDWIAKLK
ncbi:hypothetical protein GCM10009681_28340 [Luedemannella helvata]|uniref:Uncharacterized protein n=1 Tax=Luedemannella helvata TaxID=349315 RepID=A0ABN2KGK9_9ACTN